MSYERFVAFRHLRSNGRTFLSTITVIAVLGVFLGVMALTSVISVTGGFEEAFRERVLGINSHVLVIKFGIDFRDYRDIQQDIERVPGVKATSPFIFHEMIATNGDRSAGILIKGIEPETVSTVSDLHKYVRGDGPKILEQLEYDRFPDDGVKKAPHVLIGTTLAKRLDLKVGDKLGAPQRRPLADGGQLGRLKVGDAQAGQVALVGGVGRPDRPRPHQPPVREVGQDAQPHRPAGPRLDLRRQRLGHRVDRVRAHRVPAVDQ